MLAGFLRVVTHPRLFHPPTPMELALAYAQAFRERPNAVPVTPGPRHWDIFSRLCQQSGARGNLVPDAWLAALAVLIILRHRENIARLLNGTEPKIGAKKAAQPATESTGE